MLRFGLPCSASSDPTWTFAVSPARSAAGTIRPGDELQALPSGRKQPRTAHRHLFGRSREASAPQSVTLVLEDELDISRGDMLVSRIAPATVTNRFTASLVWMDEQPLDLGRRYLLKHTSRTVPAQVLAVQHRLAVDTLAREPADLARAERHRPRRDRIRAAARARSLRGQPRHRQLRPDRSCHQRDGCRRDGPRALRRQAKTAKQTPTLLLGGHEHPVSTIDDLLRLLTEHGMLKGVPTR